MSPSTEPVMTAAGIAAFASVLMGALVAFGVQLTEQQQAAVKDLVLVGFPIVAFIVAAIVARSKVTPVARLNQVPAGPRALQEVEATK